MCDRDCDHTLGKILAKLRPQLFVCKISFNFVNGKNGLTLIQNGGRFKQPLNGFYIIKNGGAK